MSPTSFRSYSTKLFFTLLVRKNLYLNFFITSFSQYTTICFVSFVYSVFNEQFRELCSLVGPSGLEPPTSCLSGTRSNLLSYEPMWLVWFLSHLNCFTNLRFVGGDDGIRTHDPLLAGQVLSQLSYTPIIGYCFFSVSFFKEVSLLSFLFKESKW